MEFKDKIIIVAGSSKGIGKATALEFARRGGTVIVNYLSSEKEANEVVEEIKKLGSNSIAIQCDVSNEQEVIKMVESVKSEFGKIDILVNNAGSIFRPGDSNTDSETWNKTMDVNLKSVWLMVKECTKYMPEGSSIVNISSYVGQLGSQYVLPYGLAKAGVINLTKAYAKELAPKIRVNSISPGNIDTEMTRGAGEDFINMTINKTPLKRLGKPEEIAKTVVFLCSDEASFITGVTLDVDGGFLLLN